MMEVIMEYTDFPSAWKELPRAIQAPAVQKLREMIRRAGTATCFIVSVALKILTSVPGMAQKMAIPSTMMQEA